MTNLLPCALGVHDFSTVKGAKMFNKPIMECNRCGIVMFEDIESSNFDGVPKQPIATSYIPGDTLKCD